MREKLCIHQILDNQIFDNQIFDNQIFDNQIFDDIRYARFKNCVT